jgi:hypothetical protein
VLCVIPKVQDVNHGCLFRIGTPAYSPGCYLKQNIPSVNEVSTCGQYCISDFK